MSGPGDHAIVSVVSADEAELARRLAALEAEVKADADAQAERKAAALEKLRAQRAAQAEEREALRPKPKQRAEPARRPRNDDHDEDDGIETAMVMAKGAKLANQARKELGKPMKQGDKSWLVSAGLSLVLGPVGWLYAGSFRESIPAAAGYVVLAAILSKLPIFLVWPVMAILLPLSAIAGLVYALSYNRHGKRQRLFEKDKDKKKLPPGA
jgi:hypothetical protein